MRISDWSSDVCSSDLEVATMLLLPLLAVSLGVPPKRSTSALGVFLGIVMIVSYHKVNQYAADIGGLGRLDPLIALWVPFLIFAALILWMSPPIPRSEARRVGTGCVGPVKARGSPYD